MGPPPLSQRVVQRIADAEDTDPTELEPPLHGVVDPDALERVFAPTAGGSPRTQGAVHFQYQGYQVMVSAGGEIQLHGSE